MTSLLAEKKDKTFTKLIINQTSNAYNNADNQRERMSFAEINLMKHRAHTTMTQLQHAHSARFRRVRSQSVLPDGSFTPRVTVGGTATDPVIGATSDHYTPDWFKISIRTVDRDNICEPDEETKTVTQKIQEICQLREKYVYKPSKSDHIGCILSDGQIYINVENQKKQLPPSIEKQYECKFEKGIMHIISKNSNRDVFAFPSFAEYQLDLQKVMDLVSLGPAKTMCYRRLKILHSRFILHQWLNTHVEVLEVKSVPHRDFYNVRKIDNHVHHSACMHQKHLLRFIKRKLKQEPDIVCFKNKDGKQETLKQVFEDIGITRHELSIDALDMHAHQETFQRFDKFNAKYNPVGKAQLRTIFLKIDNLIKGRYLAEITKEVSKELEDSRYQFAEYRLSIYGKKKAEWDVLGDWICNNGLYSSNTRWLIQMPRIYNIFRKIGIQSVQCFNDMLENFFAPLFEVTLNPATHPSLHLFLQIVVGFDSVDDESQPEQKLRKYPDPSQWKQKENPPYVYYAYYTWVNVCKLNKLREERGMNVFSFRPHCGEAGDFDHLGSAFLLANSIAHGIRLKHAPVLQYLYYLKQIGLAMSPLSNNILFTEYDNNPLPSFFKRGLNIALSTDDPLLIHYTKDALLEEYSIAAQVYNLSSIDLCELARNSVLQSGFDVSFKQHCIGRDYEMRGSLGNNIYQSNVPDVRLDFRASILLEEENFIKYAGYPQEMMRKHSINYIQNDEKENLNLKSEILDGFSFPNTQKVVVVGSPSDDEDMKTSPTNIVPSASLRQSALSQVSMDWSYNYNNIMSKPKNILLAESLAATQNMDVSKPPPHDEWISLANEKKRLEIVRDELMKFVQTNKESGHKLKGLPELERTVTKHLALKPTLSLSTTSNDNTEMTKTNYLSSVAEAKQNEKPVLTMLRSSGSSSLSEMAKEAKCNSYESPTKSKHDLAKAKKKLTGGNNEQYVINDIRGEYFDEDDKLNEIDKKFNISVADTNVRFVMKTMFNKKNKKTNVMELKCDLIASKQEMVLDELCIDKLLNSSELENNQKSKIIKCEMPDPKTGELIWNPSGAVWFKKEWKLLVGAWNDEENNLIEIRNDNSLRYIDGYGPFHGEFIGFEKFRVVMPNGQFMVGQLMSHKEIKWENGEKWNRMSDKGCLIM